MGRVFQQKIPPGRDLVITSFINDNRGNHGRGRHDHHDHGPNDGDVRGIRLYSPKYR